MPNVDKPDKYLDVVVSCSSIDLSSRQEHLILSRQSEKDDFEARYMYIFNVINSTK